MPEKDFTTALITSNGIDGEARKMLSAAIEGDMSGVEAELTDLSDSFGTEFVKYMFPEGKGTWEDQAKVQKQAIGQIVANFFDNPASGGAANAAFCKLFERSLSASMVGPVIERLPAYVPFLPIVLMRAPSKDFHQAKNGLDPLEYEDPIDRGEAYNFDPEGGGGPRVVEISGNRTTIYPYFKQTPRHALTFWEWANRQIKPIVIKKRHLTQELAKGWDDDLITHFDAVVPNATLYSSHATHIRTINNADNAVTQNEFRLAARLIEHTDSASGTIHTAVEGFALCDIKALHDIEQWGTDVWTEVEVSEFTKRGFTTQHEALVTNKVLYNYNLLKTPIETSSTNRKVRFFARKEQVGYFIPVTTNNKRIHVNIGPTVGDDPDVNAVRNVTTPPGSTFTMEAWQGGAIQIINPYAISKINHA